MRIKARPRPRPTFPHLAAASQPATHPSEQIDDPEDTNSTVQLRGLPFRATVADIESFLGAHAGNLAIDEEPAIRRLLNRDRLPSGFATVRFDSPDAAKTCCSSLHRQTMGGRYIEVSVLPSSGRRARPRAIALNTGTEPEEIVDE